MRLPVEPGGGILQELIDIGTLGKYRHNGCRVAFRAGDAVALDIRNCHDYTMITKACDIRKTARRAAPWKIAVLARGPVWSARARGQVFRELWSLELQE